VVGNKVGMRETHGLRVGAEVIGVELGVEDGVLEGEEGCIVGDCVGLGST